MKDQAGTVLVVGCGVFGVTAALELSARGHSVTIIDPGPLPHPEAASTDISKAVRMDYGSDAFYADLGEQAIDGWHRWNRRWGEQLYHEDGFLLMVPRPMAPGDYEDNGFRMLSERGQPVERIGSAELRERFPAWDATRYVDGYLNRRGGWVESGRAVARLIDHARTAGVVMREGVRFASLLEERGTVRGVALTTGEEIPADTTVLAVGAWTPNLVPSLRPLLTAVGQPVLHFRPERRALFEAERFPVWGADISHTGWYGFPVNDDGIVKVGHHGTGRPIDANEPRAVDPAHEQRCRAFLALTFPELAHAPLVGTRLCLYCDSLDGDFLIDHDPERPGLVVATGGSGHAFKFAPLLGGLIADLVEGRDNAALARFVWRSTAEQAKEEARFVG